MPMVELKGVAESWRAEANSLGEVSSMLSRKKVRVRLGVVRFMELVDRLLSATPLT